MSVLELLCCCLLGLQAVTVVQQSLRTRFWGNVTLALCPSLYEAAVPSRGMLGGMSSLLSTLPFGRSPQELLCPEGGQAPERIHSSPAAVLRWALCSFTSRCVTGKWDLYLGRLGSMDFL